MAYILFDFYKKNFIIKEMRFSNFYRTINIILRKNIDTTTLALILKESFSQPKNFD